MDLTTTTSSLTDLLPLEALLPAGFIKPDGTELAFASFRLCGSHEWIVNAVRDDGHPICYRVKTIAPSKNAQTLAICSAEPCHVTEDKVSVYDWEYPVTNYFTKRLGKSVEAPLEDWVATIMIEDAQGTRANRRRRWDSGKLETEMERVELGVVSYLESEVAASSFSSPYELESWLSRTLKRTQLHCEVMSLSNRSRSDMQVASSEIKMLHIVDGKVRKTATRPVKEDESAIAILSKTACVLERAATGMPFLSMSKFQMRWSGRAVTGYRAGPVFSLDQMEEQTPIVLGNHESSEWFGIRIAGTGIVIPVHKTMNNIFVDIDNDGFLVSMAIMFSREREQYFRRRYAFEGKWGRWLDEEEQILEFEVCNAISQLETKLHQRIMDERNL